MINKRLFVFYTLKSIHFLVNVIEVIKKLSMMDRLVGILGGNVTQKHRLQHGEYYNSYIKNTKIYKGLYRMCI